MPFRLAQRLHKDGTWQETWSALPAGSADVQSLITTVEDLYNTGATCTLVHYLLPGSGLARNGSGGGTSPVVDGGSQAGTSLDTDGWTGGSVSGVMKAGDCFTIANIDVLFRVTADADTTSGDETLSILPPLIGSAPVDGAAITIVDAMLTAVVLDYSDATAGPDEYIGGFTVTFLEAP